MEHAWCGTYAARIEKRCIQAATLYTPANFMSPSSILPSSARISNLSVDESNIENAKNERNSHFVTSKPTLLWSLTVQRYARWTTNLVNTLASLQPKNAHAIHVRDQVIHIPGFGSIPPLSLRAHKSFHLVHCEQAKRKMLKICHATTGGAFISKFRRKTLKLNYSG